MSKSENPIGIAHNESVKIIYQYEQSSQTERYFIRKHLDEYSFSDEIAAKIQAVVIGVVRYQNTINFILNQVIPKGIRQNFSKTTIINFKVAIFECRWQKIPTQDIAKLFDLKEEYLKKAVMIDLSDRVKGLDYENQLSILYSHPTFLVHTLIEKMGKTDTISLMEKNNTQAISYLRVNQLLDDKGSILDSLTSKGVALNQDKDYPFLYVIQDGLQTIVNSEFFKKGQIFIQDKASVVAVKTLDPKPSDSIWDACAAPGMKTHLIWEFMKGKGKLVASEINEVRLQEAKERFETYNIKDIEWVRGDAGKIFLPDVNKILIDAPCSSSGIIQSHPSYKWFLSKSSMFTIMTIQNKILEGIISNYSNQSGTEIVYSTCSILAHEGENQIDSILKKHENLELIDGLPIGQEGYQGYNCTNKVRRLFPHIHDTNGFFIAHFKII